MPSLAQAAPAHQHRAPLDQENDAMYHALHSNLRFRFLHLLIFGASLVFSLIAPRAHADFDDRGLVAGRVRSSYDPGVGSGSQWLTLWYATPGTGCRFDIDDPDNPAWFGCPGLRWAPARKRDGTPGWQGNLQSSDACNGDATAIGDSWRGCLSYAGSPYFSLNQPRDQYWVAVANSDPSFDQCNDGPPGLSHRISDPIADPTPNLYKIAMESLPTGAKRAHLIINASDHDFRCRFNDAPFFPLPFLSLGAQRGHGQSGPVAMLNRDGSRYPGTVSWMSRVHGYQPSACKPGEACGAAGVHAGFYGMASWNGINRLLFVDVVNEGVLADSGRPGHSKWNWPILESFYYPGADAAYLTSAILRRDCGLDVPALPLDGRAQAYRVDVSALFACASARGMFADVMPPGDIPLSGFHWYLESAGSSGWLWLSFEQPKVD
jgi:hypothetical protein